MNSSLELLSDKYDIPIFEKASWIRTTELTRASFVGNSNKLSYMPCIMDENNGVILSDMCPSKRRYKLSIKKSSSTLEELTDDYDPIVSDDIDYCFDLKESMRRVMKKENIPMPNIMETAKNKVISYAIDSIKHHFGREFVFYANTDSDLLHNIIKKFIRKYDKKFNSHAQMVYSNFIIPDSEFIIKFDAQTYLLVQTGNRMKRDITLTGVTTRPEDMYVYFFGKHIQRYIKELENIIYTESVKDMLGIYNISGGGSSQTDGKLKFKVIWNKFAPRDINTLYFSNNEEETICTFIDTFLNSKDFYTKRQLSYKTGILLYGKPGTGKSSLIRSIATKYKRSIVSINVSELNEIDLDKLTSCINSDDDDKEYIIMLEDIDTLFLNREKETTRDDNIIINKLLQFLDSNTSPDNVIFIATTNHIDRLDDALLRGGRFDLKVNVEELNKVDAEKFIRSFGIDDESLVHKILSETVDVDFNDDVCDYPSPDLIGEFGSYNQSKLQTKILSHVK